MAAPAENDQTVTSPAQIVDGLWAIAYENFATSGYQITLPHDVDQLIGIQGIQTLSDRLGNLLQTTVVAFPVTVYLYIMPVPTFIAVSSPMPTTNSLPNTSTPTLTNAPTATHKGKTSVGKAPVKDPKVPRPPNAFILYRQHWHPIVMQENPSLHNNEVSVILGKKWQAESAAVKDIYKAKANVLKFQHAQANPGYQYNPRRAGEKKRRAKKTQNQVAVPVNTITAGPSTTAAANVADLSASSPYNSNNGLDMTVASSDSVICDSANGSVDANFGEVTKVAASDDCLSIDENAGKELRGLKIRDDGYFELDMNVSEADMFNALTNYENFMVNNPHLVDAQTGGHLYLDAAPEFLQEHRAITDSYQWNQMIADCLPLDTKNSLFDIGVKSQAARIGHPLD